MFLTLYINVHFVQIIDINVKAKILKCKQSTTFHMCDSIPHEQVFMLAWVMVTGRLRNMDFY